MKCVADCVKTFLSLSLPPQLCYESTVAAARINAFEIFIFTFRPNDFIIGIIDIIPCDNFDTKFVEMILVGEKLLLLFLLFFGFQILINGTNHQKNCLTAIKIGPLFCLLDDDDDDSLEVKTSTF